MPRYFFDVKNGHRLIDPLGLNCRDDEAAMEAARAIAAQIAADSSNSADRRLAIVNELREEIGSIEVGEAPHGGE